MDDEEDLVEAMQAMREVRWIQSIYIQVFSDVEISNALLLLRVC